MPPSLNEVIEERKKEFEKRFTYVAGRGRHLGERKIQPQGTDKNLKAFHSESMRLAAEAERKQAEERVWFKALVAVEKAEGLLEGDQFKHGWNTAYDALVSAKERMEKESPK